MENNMRFTAEENSFIIEADGKKLRVSFAEFFGSHADAMAFCKENGGGDETVENLRLLAKYRDDINKELKALGKETLGGWVWTNEEYWSNKDFAFVVNMFYGFVGNETRTNDYDARAVSAL